MNIKNVMMMAAMMPAFALAETNSNSAPASVEANDTTIRVNDQNIVIKQDGEQTSVKIYKMNGNDCLLYTSPSPRDRQKSRMPSSA